MSALKAINEYKDIIKAEQYIDDVLNNRVVVCKYVRQAVERHVNDLKKSKKKNYPYHFSKLHAFKVLAFCAAIKLHKGEYKGKYIELSPSQAFATYCLFGWLKKSDDTRRYRKAYFEVARKWGKTTYAAIIAKYMFGFDGEGGAEIYTAATKRDQARICLDAAREIFMQSKIDSYGTVSKHNIHNSITYSKIEAVSSDADTLDGLNPHCAIIDEYHAHKNNEVVDVMQSAMGSRKQPLLFFITTAGFKKTYPCFQQRKVCIDVLSGKKEQDDLFSIIYTLDDEDDWEDPKVWVKSNPNMGLNTLSDSILAEYRDAKNNPSKIVNFKTKHLNIWCDASNDWISDKWRDCLASYKSEDLYGRVCYVGIDLSSVSDITAIALFFPPNDENEKARVDFRFYLPEQTVKDKENKDVDYQKWVDEGYITLTTGASVDYHLIRQHLSGAYMVSNRLEYKEDCIWTLYDVAATGYDRWNSKSLINDLENIDGLQGFDKVNQTTTGLSSATKMLEKLTVNKEIEHNNNPVFNWMLSNVELEMDSSGNIKPNKDKSNNKIDGVAALVNAITVWERSIEEEDSRFNDESQINSIFA